MGSSYGKRSTAASDSMKMIKSKREQGAQFTTIN